MSKLLGLRCRECGTEYELQATHVCEMCFGPLDVVYDQAYDLDLGSRVVELRATGRAHSRGDQVVKVPDADVLFTGDLVEAGQVEPCAERGRLEAVFAL